MKPQDTADRPAGFPHLLAEYSCPLINPPSQRGLFENKIHNIQLAIERLDPPVLQPGAVFSFWESAQAPTAENGYREGAMFINQIVRTSLGGGLCQLSGLIYNLALLSGCRIIERHNHSIDAYGEERYIPLGRDATVAYGRKNLRFANPYDFSVLLDLHVDDKRAWGAVWGAQPSPATFRIETQLLRTLPSPARTRRMADTALPPGKELRTAGLTGKIVKAWRIRELAGHPPQRELLSRDHYVCTPDCIRYGYAGQPSLLRRVIDRFGLHG